MSAGACDGQHMLLSLPLTAGSPPGPTLNPAVRLPPFCAFWFRWAWSDLGSLLDLPARGPCPEWGRGDMVGALTAERSPTVVEREASSGGHSHSGQLRVTSPWQVQISGIGPERKRVWGQLPWEQCRFDRWCVSELQTAREVKGPAMTPTQSLGFLGTGQHPHCDCAAGRLPVLTPGPFCPV